MLSEQEIRKRRQAIAEMKFDPTITGKQYFTIESIQQAILTTIDIILEDEKPAYSGIAEKLGALP